jgi:hypothetical protein
MEYGLALKQLFEDDPEVLLDVEDFHNKINTNIPIYQIVTFVNTKPWYYEFVVEGTSATIFKKKREPGFTKIDECFQGLRCLCATEEKAKEVCQTFAVYL